MTADINKVLPHFAIRFQIPKRRKTLILLISDRKSPQQSLK